MGGMIAQTVAIEHPQRVLSLVSLMSTTGRRSVGWQDPRLLPRLISGRSRSRQEYIEHSEQTWRMIGSPTYPVDFATSRVRAGETYDRGISAAGVFRQMLAVLTQPDRTTRLHRLTVPCMVIHGLSDRMIHVSGARATALAIPGAELLLIPGMGHDLPERLWPTLIDAIVRTARRAQPADAALR
jgi:pimeloyl-ACP methyl ester carboxylesterase